MGASGTTARKLTYDDLVAMPDDGLRHELIDGVHYVTASPRLPHQRILGNLHLAIGLHLRQFGGGTVYFAPVDIVLTSNDVVVPDLIYISDARAAIQTDANLQGAPDLLVEVASPSTRRRDLGIKHALYDRMDVTEYWSVEPEREFVRIYRRPSGPLVQVAELTRAAGGSLETPLLAGFALTLEDLFAR